MVCEGVWCGVCVRHAHWRRSAQCTREFPVARRLPHGLAAQRVADGNAPLPALASDGATARAPASAVSTPDRAAAIAARALTVAQRAPQNSHGPLRSGTHCVRARRARAPLRGSPAPPRFRTARGGADAASSSAGACTQPTGRESRTAAVTGALRTGGARARTSAASAPTRAGPRAAAAAARREPHSPLRRGGKGRPITRHARRAAHCISASASDRSSSRRRLRARDSFACCLLRRRLRPRKTSDSVHKRGRSARPRARPPAAGSLGPAVRRRPTARAATHRRTVLPSTS